MFSNSLHVALSDWSRYHPPKFQITALHVCDYYSVENAFIYRNKEKNKLGAILFAGTLRGEIVRFLALEDSCQPVTCSFGHSAKVVQITSCVLPIFDQSVISLSLDGTICLWNISDGICVRKFENLLPKGCQKIAVSKTAIETAAVSGAFTPIYLVNIQDGIITQAIHPSSHFVVSLAFFKSDQSEWLFSLDANGTASYTAVTTETKSYKVRLLRADSERFILFAQPSPDFTKLFSVFDRSFTVIDLTNSASSSLAFPSTTIETEYPIEHAAWIAKDMIAIVQMNGRIITYQVVTPKSQMTHDEILVKQCTPYNDDSDLVATLQTPSRSTSEETILNPFSDVVPTISPIKIEDIENEEEDHERDSHEKRPLEPELIVETDGITEMDSPVLAGWCRDVVIAFNDRVCIGFHDFQETAILDAFTPKKDPVTAQCYVAKNHQIHYLVEGHKSGKLKRIIIYLDKKKKPKTKRSKVIGSHNGQVITICSVDKILLTSGKDCMVNVFDIKNFHLITTYCQFTSPVRSFMFTKNKTDTDLDNCLFAITGNSVVSMINFKNHEVKLTMTGHEGRIENMFIHPATKLLLIEARSLYIWNLDTGNLESILSEQKKVKVLKNNSQYLKLIPYYHNVQGVTPLPIKIGLHSLQFLILNVHTVAKCIKKIVSDHSSLELSNVLSLIPNFSLVLELSSDHSRHFCKNYGNFRFKSRMDIGFVGRAFVPTVYFPKYKITGKSHWQISHLVSSVLMVTRSNFGMAMMVHPAVAKATTQIFHMNPNDLQVENAYHPSIFHLIRLASQSSQEVHEHIMEIIKHYDVDIRSKWVDNLQKLLKYLGKDTILLNLVFSVISTSLLDEKRVDTKKLEDVTKFLVKNYKNADCGALSRELLAQHIQEFYKFLTKRELIDLIKCTAKHAQKESPDGNSLEIFKRRFGELFYTLAMETVEKGDSSSAINFMSSISESISLDSPNLTKQMEIILVGFDRIAKDLTKPIFRKIDDAFSWFSYNEIMHEIAFGTIDGSLKVVLRKDNQIYKGMKTLAPMNKDTTVIFNQSGKIIGISNPIPNNQTEQQFYVLLIDKIQIDENEGPTISMIKTCDLKIKKHFSIRWKENATMEFYDAQTGEVYKKTDFSPAS